jgi:Asp-tRNA(Asn)/Glu-tRNA(Gln) amidotransferase A subunit family amidase
MDDDDLCFLSAGELADLIRTRQLSPVEIIDALLRRIDRVNPAVNAFTLVRSDEARTAAREAADLVVRLPAEDLGPLHGVPYTVKDLTPTAGIRTTYGSTLFADNVPDESGLVYQRMAAAGGIFFAKTNVPEWGFLGITENSLFGRTDNPWLPGRIVGGSSGGAAAAVAAGMGPLGLGSDAGGSIRMPASCCGVVGFKPSFGRVPIYLDDDVFETTLHMGPITRTVADAALMLSVIAGPDDHDPFSLDHNEDYPVEARRPLPAGLRVAVSHDLGLGSVTSEVAECITACAGVFASSLGAVVETVDVTISDPQLIAHTFWGSAAVVLVDEVLKPRGDISDVDPRILRLTEEGRSVLGSDLYRAMVTDRSAMYQTIAGVFREYDLLITPTAPLPAFPHPPSDRGGPAEINGRPVDWWGGHMYLTAPFNFTGHPAISIPGGFSSDGLPIGLQIIGPRHRDAAVLQAAAAYEEVAPWRDRRPPL